MNAKALHYDDPLNYPCQHCGSEAGEPCVSAGKVIAPHVARVHAVAVHRMKIGLAPVNDAELYYPCNYCNAKPGESCRFFSGEECSTHATRMQTMHFWKDKEEFAAKIRVEPSPRLTALDDAARRNRLYADCAIDYVAEKKMEVNEAALLLLDILKGIRDRNDAALKVGL